jgi:opacity protein-like surface antigen
VISDIPGTPVRDEVRIEWTAHALARAGYDVGGGWLPYVIGGLVIADVDARHVGFVTPTETFTWREVDYRVGYTLGVGIEKQFAQGLWFVRTEYIYDHWGAKRYDWVPNQRYSDIAVRIDTLRLTAVRRF